TARFTLTTTQATLRATLADGTHQLAVSLRTVAGIGAQATAQFTIDTVPPTPIAPAPLTLWPLINTQVTLTGAAGSTVPGAPGRLPTARAGVRGGVTATAAGGFTATLAAQPGDGVTLTSTDAAGNPSAPTTVIVGVPPEPATVAPPLDRSVATDLATAT